MKEVKKKSRFCNLYNLFYFKPYLEILGTLSLMTLKWEFDSFEHILGVD